MRVEIKLFCVWITVPMPTGLLNVSTHILLLFYFDIFIIPILIYLYLIYLYLIYPHWYTYIEHLLSYIVCVLITVPIPTGLLTVSKHNIFFFILIYLYWYTFAWCTNIWYTYIDHLLSYTVCALTTVPMSTGFFNVSIHIILFFYFGIMSKFELDKKWQFFLLTCIDAIFPDVSIKWLALRQFNSSATHLKDLPILDNSWP